MYHPLQDYFIAPGVPKSTDMITPVKTKPKIASTRAPGSGRKLSNRDVLVMNSTAQSAEENSPNIPCELSSINATADVVPQDKADLMLKKGTETPAKIFARMKAKVQRQNSAGNEAASIHVNNLEICSGDQMSQKTNVSQETYVIAVSPPQSSQPEEIDSSQERSSERQIKVFNAESESFIAPFVLLEKIPRVMEAKRKQMPESPCRRNKQPIVLLEKVVPVEMLAQLQQKPVRFVSGLKDIRNKGACVVFGERSISEEKDYEKDLQIEQSSSPESDPFSRSESQSDCTEIVPGPTHNLLDDPLLLLSPRVLIPRKQASVLQSKRQARQVDGAVDEATNVTGIHLRDWVVKLLNKELVVDGIRIDTMIPWHSSFIVERISSNVLKTSSGGTYVLIGKMAKHPNSLFPSWFLKKFLFGFPKMWKEYLDQFLSAYTGSQKSQKDNSSSVKPPKARKNSTSKHPKVQDITTSPVTPTDGVQQDSAKVSRSGRIIKPPLEYWKGGRIVMDSEMNVTVHEDYSTSVPSTPKKPSSQISEEKSFRPETMERERCITSSSEDELSVPMRRIKQLSKPQEKIPSNPLPAENTTRNKPPRSQKGPLVVTTMSDSIHAAKQKASRPQRASLRKQCSAEKDTFLSSGTEMKEKTKVDAVNANFMPGDRGTTYDEQETGLEENPKTKCNSKSSQKQIQVEPQPMPHDCSSLRRSSRISSRIIYSTDSNSSFTSPDLPGRQRGKRITAQKQLTKSLKTSVLQHSNGHKEQIEQKSLRGSRRQKAISQKNPDDVLVDASTSFPTDDDDEERVQHEKNTTLLLRKAKQRKGKSQPKSNGPPFSLENMHSEHSEDEERVSNNRAKKSEKVKVNSRSKKPQAKNNTVNEQDDGKWTEEELQKLHESVNSLPKHQSGYWAHVAYVVGTRSAEECHERYNAHQRKNKIPRQRVSKKPAATEEPGKEVVEITAKAGTLKRRHQMRHFLDHMPKDDHDDVFNSSPMHNKQIKLPVFAANGDDEDFSQLQNPQTPSSSMSTSAKTPQCLHISPGMLGSINKNNLDKYIFHLQKNQKGRKRNKKSAQMEKLTPTPAVRKTLKRCVAQDDDFVVWNMLSDKDMPSRDDDSDEEDDYFMEYC
ncbi:mis18-binding protein 1 [Danio aesculapii]|uniref:mis18-binding protein 1 n=1 Tax=Danio aesculapii TaxID=1142201 RepID=UPI0024BF3C38|nr:mis18-binding protein 1 [Danio aesculapii]